MPRQRKPLGMVWVYEDENSHVLEGLDMDLDARAQNPESVELIDVQFA